MNLVRWYPNQCLQTASWIGFTATTEDEALEAKQHAYGDARFLGELPTEQQLEVIEIGETRP